MIFKTFLSNTTLSISLLYTVSPTECQFLNHGPWWLSTFYFPNAILKSMFFPFFRQ